MRVARITLARAVAAIGPAWLLFRHVFRVCEPHLFWHQAWLGWCARLPPVLRSCTALALTVGRSRRPRRRRLCTARLRRLMWIQIRIRATSNVKRHRLHMLCIRPCLLSRFALPHHDPRMASDLSLQRPAPTTEKARSVAVLVLVDIEFETA